MNNYKKMSKSELIRRLEEFEAMETSENSMYEVKRLTQELQTHQTELNFQTVITDITERKWAERRQYFSSEILGILNEPVTLTDSINRILSIIKQETGFEAAGIRLRRGNDFPYYGHYGFSEDFLFAENTLLARDNDGDVCRDENGNICLECTCGLVISGQTDPVNPLFTPYGSCWTNDSSPPSDLPPIEDPRLHPRDRCIHDGFLSVALIPLRVNLEILGLLQLNDRRKGCLTLNMIHFLEGISTSIGAVLTQKQESETKFRDMFLYHTAVMLLIDASTGKILNANQSAERFYGYPLSRLLEMNIFDINTLPPDQVIKYYKEAVQKTHKTFIFSHRLASGEIRTVEVHSSPIVHHGGKMLFSIIHDITERKLAEDALRESEEKFRVLFDQAAVGVAQMRTDTGQFIRANRKYCEILGYSCQEMEQINFQSITHPEDLQDNLNNMELLKAGKVREFTIEKRYLHRDGSIVWVNLTVSPMWQMGTEPNFHIAVVQDITERKQTENILTFLAQCVSTSPGEGFFESLARYLAVNLGMAFVCIDRLEGDGLTAQTVAVWCDGKFEDNVSYALKDTPCGDVVGKTVCCFPANVCQFFPRDTVLQDLRAESYVGVTLWSHTGQPIGLIAVIGRHQLKNRPLAEAILKIVAVRASGEMERMAVEEALKESLEKYKILFETFPCGISIRDIDGNSLETNETYERILGVSGEINRQRRVDSKDWNIIYPDGRRVPAEEYPTVRALKEKRIIENIEMGVVKEKGEITWVTVTAVPLCAGNYRVVTVFNDITEKKKAEERVQQLASIVENSDDAILMKTLDNIIISWNRGAEKIYGYSSEEITGKSVSVLFPGSYEEETSLFLEKINRGVQIEHYETVRLRKDGEKIFVSVTVTPVNDITGRLVAYSTIARDITEHKRSEEILKKARDEAESANRAKSLFLASMSHEIRTPLNAVIGMTSLLLDMSLAGKQREYTEVIRSSGNTLLSLISDILDFSKIESGQIELERQPFVLRDCIESAFNLLSSRASEKGLEMIYSIESAVPHAIMGDITRLQQILANLLSNAVKFTAKGEVVLSVRSKELTDARYELEFSVKDTGIGIQKDRFNLLFEVFRQLERSTTRNYGGTGLGLAISKRLAELMGGSIGVESVEGKGSVFHFTIPADSAPDMPHTFPMTGQPKLRDRHVLIVDDNKTNLTVLQHQTQIWGMITHVTPSPYEALFWLERGDPFDIAIIDLNMPHMDGLKLTAELRKHRAGEALPVVILTSLDKELNSSELKEIAAYIMKPVNSSKLYNVLMSIFNGHKALKNDYISYKQFDPAMAGRHPLHILLVEDNVINQQVTLEMLKKLGYCADIAGNGLEAIEALRRQPYDVILMDVELPEMDGVEATRHIRSELPAQRQPHIIAMTANVFFEDREKYLKAGMNDYISKPVYIDKLIDALNICNPLENLSIPEKESMQP